MATPLSLEKNQQIRTLLLQSQQLGVKVSLASIARDVGVCRQTVCRVKAKLEQEQAGSPVLSVPPAGQNKGTSVDLFQWLPRNVGSFKKALEIGCACKALGLDSDASRNYCREEHVEPNEVYRFVKALDSSDLIPQFQHEQELQLQQQQLQLKQQQVQALTKDNALMKQKLQSANNKLIARDRVISLLTQGIVSGKFQALLETLDE